MPNRILRGNPTATENPWSLAIIDGGGYFIVSDSINNFYTRVGDFHLNDNNTIVDRDGKFLIGFLADAEGKLTQQQDHLSFNVLPTSAQETTKIIAKFNLDPFENPPLVNFQHGVRPTTPELSGLSFTYYYTMPIFDNLGATHELTMFFIKAPAEREWHLTMDIDNSRINSKVYTLIFNECGRLVVNDPSVPPQDYGDSGVTSIAHLADIKSGQFLPLSGIEDFFINGIRIFTEESSVTALVDTINAKTYLHKILAINNGSTISFKIITGELAPTLVADDFVINDVHIIGKPKTNNSAGISALINTKISGITVTSSGDTLTLTADDGRNIHLKTSARIVKNGWQMVTTVPAEYTFDLADPNGSEMILRGTYTLINNSLQAKEIVISGLNPNNVGLIAGVKNGIHHTNSDIVNFMNIDIDFSMTTSFASPFEHSVTQNGHSATAEINNYNISYDGIISAIYNNGESKPIGQIALSTFIDEYMLEPLANNPHTYSSTVMSGPPNNERSDTVDLGVIYRWYIEDPLTPDTNSIYTSVSKLRHKPKKILFIEENMEDLSNNILSIARSLLNKKQVAVCPISQQPLRSGHVTTLDTGISYNEYYIEKWFDIGSNTCPVTRQMVHWYFKFAEIQELVDQIAASKIQFYWKKYRQQVTMALDIAKPISIPISLYNPVP